MNKHSLVIAVLVFITLFSSTTLSTEPMIITGDLTDAQRETIVQIVGNPSSPQLTNVEHAERWVNVANAVGDGVANAASKLGVAANDFADSPLGMFTMVLIAWSFFGSDLLGVLFSIIWLLLLIPTWVSLYRKRFVIDAIKTYDSKVHPDGKKKEIIFKSGSPTKVEMDIAFFYWIALLIIFGVATLVFIVSVA